MSRSARWWLAGVVVVLGLMAVASAMQVDGEGVRARFERAVAAVEARRAAADWSRDVAWGEAREGSAFEHYARAFAVWRSGPPLVWNTTARGFREHGQLVSAERLEELRASWRPALAAMTAGAHCRDARPTALPPAGHSWIYTAADETARLQEQGEHLAAVRLWLDALVLAADYWVGVSTNDAIGPLSTLSLGWPDADLRGLPEEALAELDQGLARMDVRIARAFDPEERILAGLQPVLAGAYSGLYSVRTRLGAWRHGFDVDVALLADAEVLLDNSRMLVPAAQGAARTAQMEAFQDVVSRGDAWVSRHSQSHVTIVDHHQRSALARFRLLRLALAFHRRAPLPELADPFGAGPLVVEIDGDRAAFASVGSFEELRRAAERR